MRVGWIGLAVSIGMIAWAPDVARGHDDVSTAAGHLAEDSTPHDAAAEAKLSRHTRTATARDARVAAAAVAGNEHLVGSWGPLVDWPVVGIHNALLPNGKVLAYDSVGDRATETFPDHTFTRATVWDPATGTQTPATVNTGFNVFCSGLAHLMDGNVFLAGGNKNAQLQGIVQTHVFNYTTNTWSLGPTMAAGRWYPTVTPLRNGEMLITEGGPDIPEVRTTGGTLRALSSASLNLPLYPWMDVAPDGRAFYSGPDQTLRALDTNGTGTWQTFGQRDTINRDYGSHALYDIGKILVAGGGNSTADARVININGATPQVSTTAPMANGRRQFNLTALADGTVLATGGNSSGASLVDLNNGVYAAELWNPATGTWRTLAAETATRQYHSTALLLPDGRVLSSGGGICGTCDTVGYLAKNAQVFSPPYLYKTDGSGDLAPRPTIASAPGVVGYGAGLQIDTPDAAAIRKAALVRLGAVTHSVNMEQRYVPLTFTAGATTLTATAPANANIAPPGVYMLFLVDANGVPSVAKMVTVGTGTDTSPPSAPGNVAATANGSGQVDLTWTGSTDNVGVTGYRVERCQGAGCTSFTQVGTPTGTSFSDTGLGASTTYRYRVRASDAALNLSGYSGIAEATTGSGTPAPVGLVGAWSFNEGTGSTTADATGNGNTGTITSAAWSTQGRYGNALSFNGTSSIVRVASSASLNVGGAMTLSGWIRPTASQAGWRTLLARQADVYFLMAGSDAGTLRPAGGGTMGTSVNYVTGPTALAVNAWTHVAVTYDGAMLRMFINGTQVSARGNGGVIPATTNPLWIGGNQPYGEYFQGLIDDVRVYNRALTALDIQNDMNTPVTPSVPDTTPPSAPTGLNAAAASSTQVNLSWTAATDAGGIAGYRVERCAGASCTDFAEVGAPGATTFNDTGLTASTTYRYRVRAADLSSNLGAYSAIATATTPAAPDTTPPSAPTGLAPTVVDSGRIDLAWTASSDNVGVTGYRVERCPGASCTNFTEVGTPTGTTFSSTGLAAGTTYRFRVRAVDAATNFSGYSTIVNAATPAVPDTAAPSDPTGLVATANGSGQVDLTWTASSDNVGVTGYRVERCQGAGCTSFTQVGTPTGTSFSDTGLGASTTYRYRVRASDAALNLSGYSGIAEATTGATSPTPPGLVGAWGFGEGTGSTAADASGNGNTGTITSAAWSTQGHSGNALSFNGTSSVVRVAGTTSLNPGGALTMSAWIRPTASSAGWRTILARQADVYFLMAGSDAGTLRPAGGGTMGTSVNYVTGPTALAANAWTHVAVTYDGAMLRMFINGTQVSARANGGVIPATTNPLWIGGNQPYGEYFQGLIDDVRVYNRALTALDIQNDMNNGVSASGLAAQGLRLPSLLL